MFLSPRMVRIISDLVGDWRQLDERIETVTDEIETLAKSDQFVGRSKMTLAACMKSIRK
jgi:hypothetical protein